VRTFFVVLGLLAVFTVGGTMWLAKLPVVQHWLGTQLTRVLHERMAIPIHVAWIEWQPLKNTVLVGDLAWVGSTKEHANLEVPLAELQFEFGSLLLTRLRIDSVTLFGARIGVHLDDEYKAHPIVEILERLNARPERSTPGWTPAAEFELELGTVQLIGADVTYSMSSPPMQARFRDAAAEIDFSGLKPTLGSVAFKAGSYELMGWRYRGLSLSGPLRFNEQGLHLDGLRLRGEQPQYELDIQGRIPYAGDLAVFFDVAGEADVALVNRHYTDVPQFLGTARLRTIFDVTRSGRLEMQIDVQGDRIEMQGGLLDAVDIDVALHERGLQIEHLEAFPLEGGRIAATGSVDWQNPADVAVDVFAELSQIDLQWAEAFLGTSILGTQGRYEGSVEALIRGTHAPHVEIHTTGTADLDQIDILPAAPLRTTAVALTGDAHWQNGLTTIERLSFDNRWLSGEVSGQLSDDGARQDIQADFDIRSFAAAATGLGFDLAGRGGVHVDHTAMRTRVDIEAATLHLVDTTWLGGASTLTWYEEDQRLHINRVELFAAGGSLAGTASWSEAGASGRVTAVTLPIADIAGRAGISGTANGDVLFTLDAQDRLEALAGLIVLEEAAVTGQQLGDISFAARRQAETIRVDVRGDRIDGKLAYDTRRHAFRAESTFSLLLPPTLAEAFACQRLQGNLQGWVHRGSWRAHTTFAGEPPFCPEFFASATLTPQQWWINASRPTIEHRIELAAGYLPAEDRFSWSGQVSFKNFPATVFDQSVHVKDLVAETSGDVVFNRWQQTLTGRSKIRSLAVDAQTFSLRLDEPVSLGANRGVVTLQAPLAIAWSRQRILETRGRIALGRWWDLSSTGILPLELARDYIDELETASGTVSFSASVTGDWRAPVWQGRAGVAGGRLKFTTLASPIERLQGNLRIGRDSIMLDGIEGRFGEGGIRASGTIGLSEMKFGEADLELRIATNNIRINDRLSTGINGRLRGFGFLQERMTVSGDLELFGLRYEDDISWERELLGGAGASAAAGSFPAGDESVMLDVRVHGDRDLQVRTNLLQGALSLDLNVQGPPSAPTYRGTVDFLPGGLLFFRGQIYTIRRANLQYAGNPDAALLDAEATTRVLYEATDTEYQIVLNANGPLNELSIRFVSDPPLEESDILSLLSFGVLSEDFVQRQQSGGFGQQGVVELSNILLGGQLSRLEREIEALGGIDRFEIEPVFLSTTGRSTMQLTVEKEIRRRLRLRVSTALDAVAEQRIEMRYSVGRSADISVGWDSQTDDATGNFFVRPRFVYPLP